MIKQPIRKLLKKAKYLLYDLPIGDPKTIHASDVVDEWVIVVYHHQKINLRKSELPKFAAMSRADKRAMADAFRTREKKGLIKFIEIKGKVVCVSNKDYNALAEKAKQK